MSTIIHLADKYIICDGKKYERKRERVKRTCIIFQSEEQRKYFTQSYIKIELNTIREHNFRYLQTEQEKSKLITKYFTTEDLLKEFMDDLYEVCKLRESE